jgi:type IV pilus assembly protein PilE
MQYKGFTLIELLIVVAIIGIISLVAIPSYQDSVRKTRRSDGIATALAIQVAQEKFRGSCPFYAQNLGNANVCGATAALSTVQAPTASNEGFYTLAILANSATGNAYTVVATAAGTQTSDTACTPLTVAYSAANPAGTRGPAGCW